MWCGNLTGRAQGGVHHPLHSTNSGKGGVGRWWMTSVTRAIGGRGGLPVSQVLPACTASSPPVQRAAARSRYRCAGSPVKKVLLGGHHRSPLCLEACTPKAPPYRPPDHNWQPTVQTGLHRRHTPPGRGSSPEKAKFCHTERYVPAAGTCAVGTSR